MNWEQLAEALDAAQPRWATKYADQQDLRQFAEGWLTTTQLRSRVVRELYEVVRAAVHAGLVQEVIEP